MTLQGSENAVQSARTGTRWCAERDAELRALWAQKLADPEIGARMGITIGAVRNRARKIGLRHGRPRHMWSEEKTDKLVELWPTSMSAEQIARELETTRFAVYCKALSLSLPKRKRDIFEWTDERIVEVKRLKAEGLSSKLIADRFNVSRNSVCGLVHRLGLSGPKPPKKAKTPKQPREPRKRTSRVSQPIAAGLVGFRPHRQVEHSPSRREQILAAFSLKKLLLDCGPLDCRWATHTDEKGRHLFCAHLGYCEGVAGPYCPSHWAIARRSK